jgi:hypothetical protein
MVMDAVGDKEQQEDCYLFNDGMYVSNKQMKGLYFPFTSPADVCQVSLLSHLLKLDCASSMSKIYW